MRGSRVRVTQAAPVFLASQPSVSLSIVSTPKKGVSQRDSAMWSGGAPIRYQGAVNSSGIGRTKALSSAALNRKAGLDLSLSVRASIAARRLSLEIGRAHV